MTWGQRGGRTTDPHHPQQSLVSFQQGCGACWLSRVPGLGQAAAGCYRHNSPAVWQAVWNATCVRQACEARRQGSLNFGSIMRLFCSGAQPMRVQILPGCVQLACQSESQLWWCVSIGTHERCICSCKDKMIEGVGGRAFVHTCKGGLGRCDIPVPDWTGALHIGLGGKQGLFQLSGTSGSSQLWKAIFFLYWTHLYSTSYLSSAKWTRI